MQKKRQFSGYLYILPMLLLTVAFWVIPIVVSGYLSFTKYNGLTAPQWVGLQNYADVFKDETFLSSIRNTLLFVLGVVPGQTVLAFVVAAWIDRKGKTPASNFVRWSMFVPTLASTGVIGIVCRMLLNNPKSPLAAFFGLFGVSTSKLIGSPSSALPTLIVIDILISAGYYMVVYLAALTDIPPSYYEAAKVDGAGPVQSFFKITLPLMAPTTVLVVFLGVIGAFQSFDLVYTLTGGGPGTSTYTMILSLYMFGFKYGKIGYSLAIANILILLVAVLLLCQRRLLTSRKAKLY